MNRTFIYDLLRKTAISAVGASAFRGQGKGAVGRMRRGLEKLDLSGVRKLSKETTFRNWLDEKTDELAKRGKVRWGTARKALNLFLRDCLYSRYLCPRFGFKKVERWMEIPLDSVIAKELKRRSGRRTLLPPWKGLKGLRREDSRRFQDFARELARDEGMARVHLDVGMWVENR